MCKRIRNRQFRNSFSPKETKISLMHFFFFSGEQLHCGSRESIRATAIVALLSAASGRGEEEGRLPSPAAPLFSLQKAAQ